MAKKHSKRILKKGISHEKAMVLQSHSLLGGITPIEQKRNQKDDFKESEEKQFDSALK